MNQLTGHKGSIYALLMDPDGRHFYSAGGDGWIAHWPVTGAVDGKLVAEVDDQIFSITLLARSKLLVAGTMSGNLYFIQPGSPSKTRNMTFHQKAVFDTMEVHEHLVCASGDGRLSIWDIDNMTVSETILLSHSALRTIDLSPNGQMMAVGSSDHSIYLLHVPSYRLIEELKDAHQSSVFCLQFSPDGRYLLSGGRDAHLNLWDLGSFDLQQSIPAHWYTINALRYRPERSEVVTVSRDKTIRRWTEPELQIRQTLDFAQHQGHSASVNQVCWSMDGRILLTAGDDNTIIRWHND